MERKDSEASTTSLTEPIVPRGASREQATSGLSSETAPISALEIASEMETTIKGLLAKLDKSDADLNHQFQVIESGLASLKAKVER
ncbi:unnamed protein product [Kuraishia capsulata CBS 1993]|uniref:Uncharacterized protein n=1 Tax=Kuraishia capsulata CBS 1993 TaxID=1382522 RepID=W6MUL6_9ASCO|nr:uncharacterized protein KUCA_T00005370001 [Kuraishia capsulata CBS 1993]CDK29382.1 unnamed protein product [Kuraishia capsulata CBS 1993]